jgi:hypothetical protein
MSFENLNNQVEKNPNSISEVLSIGKDLATSPDKVYRSVRGDGAIKDLYESGVVRNAQSAGVREKSRWGDRVFWSRGADDKFHIVDKDGFVIEAPHDVAKERIVTKEDVTAIYRKEEEHGVVDILKDHKKEEVNKKIAELRKQLGIDV